MEPPENHLLQTQPSKTPTRLNGLPACLWVRGKRVAETFKKGLVAEALSFKDKVPVILSSY